MKTFQTTNGKTVLVSDCDYQRVARYKWHARKNGYVTRNTGRGPLYLHRFILNAQPCDLVDHRNRDPLRNTRSNLRLTTPSKNRANSRKMLRKGRALSAHKGVTRKAGRAKNPWQVYICAHGKPKYLGTYPTELDAARAYDAAAVIAFGSFACTNKALYGI